MLAISDLFEFPISTGERPFAPLSSNLLLFLDGGGGGNFTKEDDYRGTRGERGDAVKGRFCHNLVQPSISGACLSRVCVCVWVLVYVCANRILLLAFDSKFRSKFLGKGEKYFNSRIRSREK